MKVGLFGGSFNPVHFGHVGLAKWVIEHTDLDELWLLVSPNNPLKPADMLTPEEQRLEAVRKAVKDIPHVVASDFEFALPRPSYTADTLRALQTAFPLYDFTLVIGEDNWTLFDRWREHDYILANYRIFVYPRHPKTTNTFGKSDISNTPNSPITPNNPIIPNVPITPKGVFYLAEAPLFDISSTQIRNNLKQ